MDANSLQSGSVLDANQHGLEFTEEEAHAFMAAEAKAAASGELSDTQLEAVAGGKSGKAKAMWSLDGTADGYGKLRFK